uniref:Uncharacterized protein n=1 Tax=Arundo donax TaxID=35708 RepID=A0A0A9HA48_ARUDO
MNDQALAFAAAPPCYSSKAATFSVLCKNVFIVDLNNCTHEIHVRQKLRTTETHSTSFIHLA